MKSYEIWTIIGFIGIFAAVLLLGSYGYKTSESCHKAGGVYTQGKCMKPECFVEVGK